MKKTHIFGYTTPFPNKSIVCGDKIRPLSFEFFGVEDARVSHADIIILYPLMDRVKYNIIFAKHFNIVDIGVK